MNEELSKDQQKFLLKLARETIKHYLETGEHIPFKTDENVLKEKRGAFVTIKKDGQLRGCIGYPIPYLPLYKTIIEASVMAAFKDPRFPPIQKKELPAVDIEISVLSLPQKVEDASEVKVGKHGIIVSRGANSGLLLPQVPLEWEWDLGTYLKHGCLKAGLEEDALNKGAEIKTFTAQVFSEQHFNLPKIK
ncbi:MAG: AmmeMemoRadiSam system protein A [Candidatus Aminicenantes bacterium]|nr:AmmeMemoRadiSam system protein A [Candidatus Aminicenantes bacterium]